MKEKIINTYNNFLKMRKRHRVAIIIIAVSFLWILSGLLIGGNSDDKTETLPAKIMKVKAINISPFSQERYISTYGVTEASIVAEISSETNGKVIKISDKEGQLVTADEVIIWLDKRDSEESLQFAESLLAQRKLEYKSAKALSKKGLRSDVNLAIARTNLDEAILATKRAKKQLSDTEIKSPFNGLLDRIYVDIGLVTNENQKQIMAKIVNLDPLLIVANLSASEAQNITINMPITAIINNVKYNGVVSYLSKVADENTKTFRLESKINNPNLVPAGVNADLMIYTGTEKVHKIPPSSLSLNDNGDLGVKIVDENNIVHFKKIKILSENDKNMIISGINGDIKLITVGGEFVKAGSKVLISEHNQLKGQ